MAGEQKSVLEFVLDKENVGSIVEALHKSKSQATTVQLAWMLCEIANRKITVEPTGRVGFAGHCYLSSSIFGDRVRKEITHKTEHIPTSVAVQYILHGLAVALPVDVMYTHIQHLYDKYRLDPVVQLVWQSIQPIVRMPYWMLVMQRKCKNSVISRAALQMKSVISRSMPANLQARMYEKFAENIDLSDPSLRPFTLMLLDTLKRAGFKWKAGVLDPRQRNTSEVKLSDDTIITVHSYALVFCLLALAFQRSNYKNKEFEKMEKPHAKAYRVLVKYLNKPANKIWVDV